MEGRRKRRSDEDTRELPDLSQRGDDMRLRSYAVMRQRFKHRGCKGRLERIPINIRDEYLDRAVVSLT